MADHFDIAETPLSGLMLISRKPRRDERGYLERLYDADALGDLFGRRMVMQVNRTLTQNCSTVRGMHFQLPPHAELKLVSCLHGCVFDVAVDLRKGSPTFLRWHAAVLSEQNAQSLLIPEGFAHGFQTLTENCEMLYLHTETHQLAHERGLHPEDRRVDIDWPHPVTGLSPRDTLHPWLTDAFEGIEV